MDWLKRNRKSLAEISFQDILTRYKIEFEISNFEQIGFRLLESEKDLEHYKKLIEDLEIDAIRKEDQFDGTKDYVLFFLLKEAHTNRSLILGLVDPVELYANPNLLAYKFF